MGAEMLWWTNGLFSWFFSAKGALGEVYLGHTFEKYLLGFASRGGRRAAFVFFSHMLDTG